jgi:hypothetical protein
MSKSMRTHSAHVAILTLAEIKAAADAFDRGDTSVFDALDSIGVAVDAYRAALPGRTPRGRPRRGAA